MTRRDDWPERLAAHIAAHKRVAFAYGPHDCARFAAGAVTAQTGKNPMAGMRYASAKGALRILAREGGLRAALAKRLPEIPHAQAKRGDIGLAEVMTPEGVMLSTVVVLGAELVGVGRDGLAFLPRAALRAAFEV